jgi:hypothetical protein
MDLSVKRETVAGLAALAAVGAVGAATVVTASPAEANHNGSQTEYVCFWTDGLFTVQFLGNNSNYGYDVDQAYNHGVSGLRACAYATPTPDPTQVQVSVAMGQGKTFSRRNIQSNKWVDGTCT